ncbi:unnamed protein product [Rotaria sp. Silwood2]|nr:unnamed protein product [Rotaria sp. Silwood2]CAF2870170.1 unnamed protein product [Rotaria sp. Silwood2]CAF3009254.1 unnamed protein product [Rotaria sp. Silwood2]CAF3266596.1 unnamed protein product [Rotaria sp. Silwood2]CAF4037788.1 unnamed protein product [Rotaria sp. Silwood2]
MSVFEAVLQIKFWSPIISFLIGAPAALLNVIIFIGIKAFRRSPLAFYVVGQSLSDLTVLLIMLLQIAPHMSQSASSIACKLTVFFIQIAVAVAMSFLCLCAFDRWACTSQSVRIRQLSSIAAARRLFPIPFIFWSISNIPFLIYCDLVPPKFACWFTNDRFMRIGTLVLSPILTIFFPLTVLILFGLLTYRNIRLTTHVRQQANQTCLSTWEQQMTRMMLAQTLLSICCTLPRAVFVIYSIATIGEDTTRSFDQLSIVLLVDYLTVCIISANFTSSFYIFLLSSPRLRQTIQVYLKRCFNAEHRQTAPTNISLTAQTLTGRQTRGGNVHPAIQNKQF